MKNQLPQGFRYLPGYFSRQQQEELVELVRAGIKTAPFYQPRMPKTGQPTSVIMSNFGELGWVSEKSGYRYDPLHPKTAEHWPKIPQELLDLWGDVTSWPQNPQSCLINWYREGSRLGLHIDASEQAKDAPIVSVSLGDQALYRIGGLHRNDPTRSFKLSSGDVLVLADTARHCYHGVDRIYDGTSTLIPKGGRINLTLRVVR
ncbi:MAG: alpha-ketoglutarate-dependent dioxygenase AlkB [Robiginitomaculum sp.]|nr:alpha-ketoglutarate-dependent dioxygenase AlkB [Robiginitomaculum sp.]MBL4617702.1 alpha-ketoglutarate-dependent dioxygenase AlkB [Robiginitomaculum sp.]